MAITEKQICEHIAEVEAVLAKAQAAGLADGDSADWIRLLGGYVLSNWRHNLVADPTMPPESLLAAHPDPQGQALRGLKDLRAETSRVIAHGLLALLDAECGSGAVDSLAPALSSYLWRLEL